MSSKEELMLLNCGGGEDLRVPWIARSNQSVLKEISPEYSLEGLMLKLKLQYFDHLMRRTDSLEKTLMLGKMEGRRRRGWQDKMVGWHHRLNGHEFEQTLRDSEGQRSLVLLQSMGSWRVGRDWVTEPQQREWTAYLAALPAAPNLWQTMAPTWASRKVFMLGSIPITKLDRIPQLSFSRKVPPPVMCQILYLLSWSEKC